MKFTNKLLEKGQNEKKKKKLVSLKRVFRTSFLLKKFTAKTVEEHPVAGQRWISRKEI